MTAMFDRALPAPVWAEPRHRLESLFGPVQWQRTVGTVDGGPGNRIGVDVVRVDVDGAAGDERVQVGTWTGTPTEARMLAAHLLSAADLLDGAGR